MEYIIKTVAEKDLHVPVMRRPPLLRWLIILLYWWLPPGDGELPLNREWVASTSVTDVVVLLMLLSLWCKNS